MTFALMQPSFAAGEISPSLLARVDLAKYHIGAAVMRNHFVDYRGGAASRPGTRFIGSCKSPYAASPGALLPVRLVPFQFNINQTYALEFGNFYMRIITNGGYVLETGFAIAGANHLNPPQVLAPGNNFNVGDWVVFQGMQGLTQYNGKTFIVSANLGGGLFTFTDLFGNNIDPSTLTNYTSGGTVSRIYTVVSPYAANDLASLKWTQSADTLTITHNSYPIQNLKRLGATNWAFSTVTFTANQNAPSAISAVPSNTTPTPLAQFAYCVTAVNASTGEESIASNIVSCQSVDIAQTAGSILITWAAVTGAGSYRVYKAPVGYNTTTTPIGALFGLIGTTNGLQMTDGNIVADFNITPPVHQNPFANSPIIGVYPVAVGSGYAASTTASISDPTGVGAVIQPIVVGGQILGYIIINGGQNYTAPTLVLGSTGGGTGATASFQRGSLTGNYPGCTCYYQQRQYFANTLNFPSTFWATKTGIYTNMDVSNPVQDDDAIEDTISSQQVNGILDMIPMTGGLVMLTGLGAWQLTGGGNSTAVTPNNADATPQAYNGCNANIPPITINYDILYVQAKGSIVRDLAYNFFVNIYTGNDLTVLSNHLFTGYTLKEWAWAEEPYKIVWAIRNDGALLSLTYLKEQDVYAWARHDTFGLYQSVCTVSEPPVDAVYVIVQRFIRGVWVQYVERMDNRIWPLVENTWAVDAGLQSPLVTFPNVTLSAAAASGSNIVFTASSATFGSQNVGNVIRMGNGIATISSVSSPTQVVCDITQAITNVIPDDPLNRPIPAAGGQWSVGIPLTQVSGLDHLEGATVQILADGSVQPPQQVVKGTVTLSGGPTLATVGLGFQAQLASMPIDSGSPTIQGKRKSVPAVTVRVLNSRGLKVGQGDFSKVVEIKERGNNIFAGQPIPLFTGDQRIILNPQVNKTGQVYIQQDYPLPSTILGIMPDIVVGDTNG